MSDINWTTRAAFAISLITSVLAVVFGTRLQRRLYLIGGPRDLRLWLGNGVTRKPINGPDAANPEIGGGDGNGDWQDRLESSIHAIRILQLPVELFAVSWITFIVALILYTALMWRQHSNPGGDDYRNIMICLLLVLFMLVGYYEFARAMKDIEERNVEDATKPEESISKDSARKKVLQVLELARIGATTPQNILFRHCNLDVSHGEDGRTPLMYAAQSGNMGQVLWLLRHGANPTLGGNRAQMLAEKEGHKDVALVLQFNTPSSEEQSAATSSADTSLPVLKPSQQ